MEFEVKPLLQYDGARYPTPEEPLERERSLSLKLLVVVFSLAMALGLMACVDQEKAYHPDYYKRAGDSGPGDGDDGDYDILLGAPPECTPGEAFCQDHVYAECTDGYTLEYTDCDAWCREQTGMDAEACDASAVQPCDCYDIIDGDVAECTPGDVQCGPGNTLGTCDNYYYEYAGCDAICQEQLGEPLAYSQGCDVTQSDPCQCRYDMIDGGMTECLPGDVTCGPDNTVGTCDNYFYEYTDCDAHCQEQLGEPYAYSLGCDANQASDPCQCQYDMIDGGIAAECVPGDVTCGPNNTLGTCDSHFYQYIDCDQYCREYLGTATATSQGCDASDAADPCTCVDDDGGITPG
jgi:hypothetical protein